MDKKTVAIWVLAIAILIISCALIAVSGKYAQNLDTISALQTKNSEYKLENGKVAISTRTITLPKREAPKTAETKPFVKVETVIKTIFETKIDTVYVPFKDTVPCVFRKEGRFASKEQSFNYRVDNHGFGVYAQVIRDSITIVHGSKRKWFLGEETRTTDISHSNKYVKTTSLSHTEYKDPVKWYETGLFKFGIGVIVGAAISR